jgi:hypothetical protein
MTTCPFRSLSQDYTELVCGMNLDLSSGLVQTLDESTLRAALTPAPNRCCVTLTDSAEVGG